MEKSSEGVVIRSLDSKLGQLKSELAHLHPLPKLARLQFINDIKQATGSLNSPHLPLSIKPYLAELLEASKLYLEKGDEQQFIPLCSKVISLVRQGWNHLCYWVSQEQNHCYNIYWGLKAALERHHKHLSMYSVSRNDAAPKMQFYKLPLQKMSRRSD